MSTLRERCEELVREWQEGSGFSLVGEIHELAMRRCAAQLAGVLDNDGDECE